VGEAIIDYSVLEDAQLIEKIPEDITSLLIHESVLKNIEQEAAMYKTNTLQTLKELEKKYSLVFVGEASPDSYSAVRDYALAQSKLLLTVHPIQYTIAKRKGVNTLYLEKLLPGCVLEEYFDQDTLSVHFKEKAQALAKKGSPGNWITSSITEDVLTYSDMRRLIRKLFAYSIHHGSIEDMHTHSYIMQVDDFRLTITEPPLTKGIEITAVRPTKQFNLEVYGLSQTVKERILKQAEGVIIAGAPGMGKTTFVSSIIEQYVAKNRIVKTIESPRDLVVSEKVSQIALHKAGKREIQDVLLLSRPDNVVFDEMRTSKDFDLFTDLRLSGIGMVGVMHASAPIDAIQRFLGRVELGMLPHIVDTMIFIENGKVKDVYTVNLSVKVPYGMSGDDLARPVVIISCGDKQLYELYSYGDQIITSPLGERKSSPLEKLAKRAIMNILEPYTKKAMIEFITDTHIELSIQRSVKETILAEIEKLENNLGLRISIKDLGKEKVEKTEAVPYKLSANESSLFFDITETEVCLNLFIGEEFLMSAKSSKKGMVKVKMASMLGEKLAAAIKTKQDIIVCRSA